MPVCLIGNLCVDVVVRGLSGLPQWGMEVAGTDYRVVASGQTTYTALALRALGVNVSVIGRVGRDDWGEMILSALRDAAVDVSGVEHVHGSTAVTVAAVRSDGERAFISEYGCLKERDNGLIERHRVLLEPARAVCLLGTFSFPGIRLASAAALLAPLRERGIMTVLDTGWDPMGFPDATCDDLLAALPAFTLFMPNAEESQACSKGLAPEQAAGLFERSGAEEVVVKLGSEGGYRLKGEEAVRFPAFPVRAVDTVGAGDVFNAAYVYGRLQGWGTDSTVRFASAAAAIRVASGAPLFPSAAEIDAFLESRDAS